MPEVRNGKVIRRLKTVEFDKVLSSSDYWIQQAFETLDEAFVGSNITVTTTSFDGILSASDNTVQKALDTLDDHLHDGQTLQCDGIVSDGGAFTFSTSGSLSIQAVTSVIFNEAGNDVDFRIEANDYSYALFVRGSDGLVGIGTSSPTATLHVLNVLDVPEVLIFKLEGKRDTPTNNDTIYIDYTMNNDASVSFEYARTTIRAEDITATEEEGSLLFEVARNGDLEVCLKISATEIVINEAGADRDFRIEASGVANAIFVQGSDGAVGINKAAPSQPLDVVGNVAVTGSAFIGDGGTTNYLEVEADGTIEFHGTATVWDDLRVPVSSIKRLGFTDPAWVQFRDDGATSTGVYALAFDGAGGDEEIFFSVQIPHAYKEGSDITPHVHWAPSNANAGNVRWSLEYTWANIDGTYGNTTEIHAVDSTDTTSHKHLTATFTAISGTGKTISSMLMCRLHRNSAHGDDTYGSDAFLLEIDFHYEIDTIGSRQISIK